MNNLTLQYFNGDLNPEDRKIMVDGMLTHHLSNGHKRESSNYSITLKDENNVLRGTVMVTFLWNGMEIQTLWVDESMRRQGWGRKLMELVEIEGIKRGCTIAYTNTFSWQAPEFYKKLGYEVFGMLDNFPHKNKLTYLKKQLS